MTKCRVIDCEEIEKIQALMPGYLNELREFDKSSNTTDYPYLDFYWREPDRHPFLIQLDNRDCGFALVRKESSGTQAPDYHSIVEFYIEMGARRQGLGREAVEVLLDRFRGPWLVQVLLANQGALKFWQSSLSAITGHDLVPSQSNKFYEFYFTS